MRKDIFSLSGKVIVITGAAGLLGKKHADAVATFGANPQLIDLKTSLVGNLAVELSSTYGVDACGWEVDITDEDAVRESCANIMARYGRIDGLINNAAHNPDVAGTSTTDWSRLEQFERQLWDKDIAVGLTGSFLCAKHYGQHLAENPGGGVIINISSDLGLIAPDHRLYRKTEVSESLQAVKPVTYSVVKTGLIGLTRYLATYWPEGKVRCNALCPGGVENQQPAEFLNRISSRIPIGRLAQSDEYQGTLVWMLSDAASYLNGAIVSVDGGRTTW